MKLKDHYWFLPTGLMFIVHILTVLQYRNHLPLSLSFDKNVVKSRLHSFLPPLNEGFKKKIEENLGILTTRGSDQQL